MYTWADKTTVYANSKVTRRALSVLGQCGHMIILDPFLSRHIPTLLFIPRDFCPRKSTFQCCFYAAWALNASFYLRIFSDFTWRCSVLKVNLPVALHNPAAVSAMQVWVSVSLCLSISLFFFFVSPLTPLNTLSISAPWVFCCAVTKENYNSFSGRKQIWQGVPH